MDFEAVVGREDGDGGVESRVVGDGVGDLVLYETFWLTGRWPSDFFMIGGRRRLWQKLEFSFHLRRNNGACWRWLLMV